jgi:hypothetical protein
MLSLIPPNFVQSLVRHALTFAGGYLLTTGLVDAAYVEMLVGFGTTTAGLVWSYFTHTPKPPAG